MCVMGMSGMYESPDAMENDIVSVKKIARSATIYDQMRQNGGAATR